MNKKTGLGKGLSALIPDSVSNQGPNLVDKNKFEQDILITPGGDNISPLKIENELINSEFIEQAVVYGDNKPYLVALIVVNDEKINVSSQELDKEIEKININLANIEKIKKYFLINEKFTIENGMLTPTLKLKRYKIIQKYKNSFEKLY